jgi:hypothetical protein
MWYWRIPSAIARGTPGRHIAWMSEVPVHRSLRASVLAVGLLSAALAFAQDIPTDESGFTTYLAKRLRQELGDVAVSIKGPLTLSVGQFQANLDRIYSYCKTTPGGCAKEVDTYVKGAAEAHRDRNAAPTKEAIRVVVRPAQYLQQAQRSFPPGAPAPQTRPFVDGLVVVPVQDSPRTLRMLTEKDSAGLGLTANQVHELAIANLRKTLKPLTEIAKVVGHAQIGQLVGDTFHPSRLVLLDSWAPLAEAQGGILIVVAPATDAVLYIGEDSPIAIDALRTLSRNVMARAPNRLSDVLLRWTPKGWQVVR